MLTTEWVSRVDVSLFYYYNWFFSSVDDFWVARSIVGVFKSYAVFIYSGNRCRILSWVEHVTSLFLSLFIFFKHFRPLKRKILRKRKIVRVYSTFRFCSVSAVTGRFDCVPRSNKCYILSIHLSFYFRNLSYSCSV